MKPPGVNATQLTSYFVQIKFCKIFNTITKISQQNLFTLTSYPCSFLISFPLNSSQVIFSNVWNSVMMWDSKANGNCWAWRTETCSEFPPPGLLQISGLSISADVPMDLIAECPSEDVSAPFYRLKLWPNLVVMHCSVQGCYFLSFYFSFTRLGSFEIHSKAMESWVRGMKMS